MDFMQDMCTEVFISFKNSDEGQLTKDSEIARSLYDELASRKICTFCSNANLLSLGQSVYKKSIDEALESTKVLIVVSTKIEYLNSEWVKYEWESFHHDILSGMKKHAQIVPYLANFTREQTPRSLRDFQTFNVNAHSVKDVADFVQNILSHISVEQKKVGDFSESERFNMRSQISTSKVRQSLYTSDSGREYERLKIQAKNTHECDMMVIDEVVKELNRPLWILDIGCAYNYVGNMRFSKIPNAKVLGVDINEKCLEFAAKNSDGEKFFFRKLDLEDFMMEDTLREYMDELGIEQFDIAFGALVVHHLKKPVTVLKKLRKFIAHDGYMILRGSDDGSVLAFNDNGLVKKIVDKCMNTVGFSDRQNGRKLYHQLESAGYQDIKVKTWLKDSSNQDIDGRDELFFERFSYRINYFNKIMKADPHNEQKRSDFLFMRYALEELEETFANHDFWYCEHDFIAWGKVK